MLRKVYYFLSPELRRRVRKIIFLPVDLYETVFNKRQKLVPPKGLIYTGTADFAVIGDKMFRLFVAHCDIQPHYIVLDVGSGMGRMARPFTQFLSDEGAYEGFDVVDAGIQWCRKAYRDFPNFHFQYVALRNDLYNLSTNIHSSQFTFPYPGSHFDFILVISVFTHMQPEDVAQYLKEIERVLKPGCYCFCTFFIITNEVEAYLERTRSSLFTHKRQGYFLHDETVKDANIAYRDSTIREMVKLSGLQLEKFLPGWWPGYKKQDHPDYQDIIILRKQ